MKITIDPINYDSIECVIDDSNSWAGGVLRQHIKSSSGGSKMDVTYPLLCTHEDVPCLLTQELRKTGGGHGEGHWNVSILHLYSLKTFTRITIKQPFTKIKILKPK